MDFIECEKIQGTGYCTDNDCSCTLTPLSYGEGYIYISNDVVRFRQDALGVKDAQAKLERMNTTGEYISVSRYAPILICDDAARKRNLDLAVAKEDALTFWRDGRVPLRATPSATIQQITPPPPDVLPETPQPDPEQVPASDTIGTTQARDNSSDAGAPDSSLVPPVTPKVLLKPDLPEVSADEVAAQYSSGPLAELAKRMASDLEKSKPGTTVVSSKIPLEATLITSKTNIRQLHKAVVEQALSQLPETTQQPPRRDTSTLVRKPARKAKVPTFLVVSGILFTLALAAAIVAFLKLQPVLHKPAVTTAPYVEPPAQPPQLTRSFFERSYLFEDYRFKGSMTFTLSGDSTGTYNQSVLFKETGKTFPVHGVFSYSLYQITFRPDSYTKDIIWVLDTFDQEGNTVFHDPSELNGELARIDLRREQ